MKIESNICTLVLLNLLNELGDKRSNARLIKHVAKKRDKMLYKPHMDKSSCLKP